MVGATVQVPPPAGIGSTGWEDHRVAGVPPAGQCPPADSSPGGPPPAPPQSALPMLGPTPGLHRAAFLWDTAVQKDTLRCTLQGDGSEDSNSAIMLVTGSQLCARGTGRQASQDALWQAAGTQHGDISAAGNLPGHSGGRRRLARRPDGQLLTQAHPLVVLERVHGEAGSQGQLPARHICCRSLLGLQQRLQQWWQQPSA
jgi:hypothetical protein